MALILSIETATSVCSVAVHKEGVLLSQKEINSDKSHSQLLLQYVEEVLTQSGITKTELDAVAVSEGPGSYTGLRIGLSTAKGLCYALDIPLIAVNTLDAMARLVVCQKASTLLVPMIDARRMEVYTALYTAKGERIQPLSAMVVDEKSFSEILQTNEVVFFGNGAEKCKSVITSKNAFFEEKQPSAIAVGVVAFEKYKLKKFEDVAYFEPNYLKEFYTHPPKKNHLLNNIVPKP